MHYISDVELFKPLSLQLIFLIYYPKSRLYFPLDIDLVVFDVVLPKYNLR